MTHPAPTEPHDHGPEHNHAVHTSAHLAAPARPARSVLAWPAWLRVLAVLPVVLALWLAVGWTNAGVVAW
ncbi:MAG: hypothetical protein CVU24_12865 [Betaproteobacteria bacterium HGW-Betaproteobacteria-18]|nr:MAG: hypothetical protein CVU24_12865 [Betaproteobacteria bacterium HGW-Betaproteobacteria-18]